VNTRNGRVGDGRETGNDWGMNTLLYVRMQDAGWSVEKLQASKHQAPEKLQKPNREPGGPPVLFRLGRLSDCAALPACESGVARCFPPQSKTISGGKVRPYPASGRGAGRFGLNGLTGLVGLESVWDRFTRCGFWGEKGRKIGLHGLERFTAGGCANRFGRIRPPFVGCGAVRTPRPTKNGTSRFFYGGREGEQV
jgi:hypothetical protein